MKQLIFFLFPLLVLSANPCLAQDFNQIELTSGDIPPELIKNEELLLAKKWSDINGSHLFIVTRTLKKSLLDPGIPESVCFSALLKAQEFILTVDGLDKSWSFRDSVMDCPFDLWIGLVPKALILSDLDSNGVAEVFLATGNLCTADVFPINLKLIFKANNKTHMLEGAAYSEFFNGKKDSRNFEYDLSKTDPPESYDWFKKHLHSLGRYKNTNTFENTDQRFLPYIIEKWKEYSSTDFFPEWTAQAPR